MTEEQSPSEAKSAFVELAELKLPLVLRDYQGQFDKISREYERRSKLYQWEVTTVIGLAVIFSRLDPIPEMGWIPLMLTVLFFWILDGRRTFQTDIYQSRALDIERRLEVSTLIDFSKAICEWKLGVSEASGEPGTNPYLGTLKCGCRVSKIVWHGGLITVSIAVFTILRP